MVQTRSADEARERWASNAGNRQNYESGVESPLRGWKESTSASTERWRDAVRQAAENGQFTTGIDPVTDNDWQSKSLEVGAQRLNQGVQANVDKFESNIEKFIDVIESTDLPAKGPTGDVDTNIERSRVMAQALRDAKVNE
jgi:hypothetical protein